MEACLVVADIGIFFLVKGEKARVDGGEREAK